ncbi:MAG: hypothetical protein B6U78_01780 [Candidatus Aenigmarchaeota archaeon ex4484_224]|nr:MAG: hypothetical protein B6U78_01780 [Candidatus Aenigmarchaeota archaeon ex4484_224]
MRLREIAKTLFSFLESDNLEESKKYWEEIKNQNFNSKWRGNSSIGEEIKKCLKLLKSYNEWNKIYKGHGASTHQLIYSRLLNKKDYSIFYVGILHKNGLIERASRQKYKITEKGEKVLKNAEEIGII